MCVISWWANTPSVWVQQWKNQQITSNTSSMCGIEYYKSTVHNLRFHPQLMCGNSLFLHLIINRAPKETFTAVFPFVWLLCPNPILDASAGSFHISLLPWWHYMFCISSSSNTSDSAHSILQDLNWMCLMRETSKMILGIFTVRCYLTVRWWCKIIDGLEVSWDGLNSCSFHKGNCLSLPRSVWTSDWARGGVFNTSFQYLNTCWLNFPGALANQGLAFPILCPAMGRLPRATADTISAAHQVWSGNYVTVGRTQTLR